MGDMGLQGAFATGSLQSLLRQRMQDRIDAELRARHNLESDRNFQLAQQAQQSNEQLKQAELAGLLQSRQAAQQDQQFKEDQAVNEAVPAGTKISDQNPLFGRLQRLGAVAPEGIVPQAPPASIAANPDDVPTEMPGTIANSPMLTGKLFNKLPTAKQQEFATTAAEKVKKDAADAKEKADTIARETVRDKETARHNKAMETKEPAPHFLPLAQYENAQPTSPLAFDSLTGTARPIPGAGANHAPVATPGAAQAAQHEAAKKEVLGTLDQLDQAIEGARPFLGPGRGQFTSLQQMIGSQDPAVQTLATKMLLGKMQVDHAAAGTVRAGSSPQLLARWDNILGQKVTPEGLKAAVQAMREIIGGMGTAAGGGVPTVGGTFQGEKVLKVEKVQ